MKLQVGKRYNRRSMENGCLYVQIVAESEDLGLQLARKEFYGIMIYADSTDTRIMDRRFFAWYEDGRYIANAKHNDPVDLVSEYEGMPLVYIEAPVKKVRRPRK